MSSELIFGLFCLVFVVGTFWLSAVFEGRRRDREQKTQQILEEAAQQTLSNLESFNSRTYFITHHDPEINRLAAELADDRYPLSMEQQKVFVPEEKRLVEIVPRVINDYKHAIIGVQKEEVLRALRQPELLHQPDKMNELLKKLIDINEIEKQFAKVLGDRVLVR